MFRSELLLYLSIRLVSFCLVKYSLRLFFWKLKWKSSNDTFLAFIGVENCARFTRITLGEGRPKEPCYPGKGMRKKGGYRVKKSGIKRDDKRCGQSRVPALYAIVYLNSIEFKSKIKIDLFQTGCIFRKKSTACVDLEFHREKKAFRMKPTEEYLEILTDLF